MHGLVCLIVAMIVAPLWAKLVGVLFVVVSTYFIPQKVHPVLELAHDEEKHWYLHTKRRSYRGVLSDMSWISPFAAILIFNVTGQKRGWPVVLFPDAVDKTTLRRLILYLNITRGG